MAGLGLLLLSCSLFLPGTLAQDLFLASPEARKPTKPNLVWFLTDDQDQLLGGSFPTTSEATPMPKTRRLLQEQGVTAENWYIHTPICSPSRSELVTGRYFHNVKQVGGKGYCSGMHVNYTLVNNNTFAKVLKEEAGYTVGLFGKYLNEMPETVPPGFDAWLANGGGDYIAPAFQTKNIDGLPDGSWKGTSANYSTSVIGNTSIAWIKKVAKEGKPFLAYIAPKAAHEPFNPAPWYVNHWDPSWPEHEPRPENWNCSFESRRKHHGNIAEEPMITEDASRVITGVFKNRWRTLMSVDDVIAEVVNTVEELGLLESTYFFYSSDHGFQLGQFNIPMDKRHVYEWNTKIHLLARGPGIAPGSTFAAPGTQVDIAPTLLGFAGLRAPPSMDGKSIVPFLVRPQSEREQEVLLARRLQDSVLLESTQHHLKQLGDLKAYAAAWRREVFIEYYYCADNIKCVDCGHGSYPESDSYCVNLADNSDCWCGGKNSSSRCYPTEDLRNNFIALRELGGKGAQRLYAEFQTGDQGKQSVEFDNVDFIEYYDVEKDPWEMENLADSTPHAMLDPLHERLHRWFRCTGSECP